MSRAESHKRVFGLFGWRGLRSVRLRFPFEKQMPQPEKGSDMFKSTLVVMLAALFGNGTVFAQENRGTPEQRPHARLTPSISLTPRMWRPVSGKESQT